MAILRQALDVFIQILKNARHADIIAFHASIRGGRLFAGMVRLAAAVSRRKWLFRGFGGDFGLWYERASGLQRLLFRATVLGAQCVLLETNSSVRYFQGIARSPVRWYANSRPLPETPNRPNSGLPARKFVYVGHVRPGKGILDLLHAADRLPDGIIVDIYGPMSEGLTEEVFHGRKSHYCGAIQPEQISGVLARYDVLVLPTYLETEGYPGVILEAYTTGLPVIATRCGAIPEIVDTESGILIQPRDTAQLENAMTLLINSAPIMDRLRSGVMGKAREFSSDVWTDKFVDILKDLSDSTRSPTIP
ncbi:MAG: glycosyltransferase family 4 protein [Acidiferrobacterales bacterium]